MDQQISRILQKYADKISHREYLNLCQEIKRILEEIIDEKYAFEILIRTCKVLSEPDDLIVPWKEIDHKARKDTLDLLKSAREEALKLQESGLSDLLESYGSYSNLAQFFDPIMDREYTDLYTLSEWGL